MNAKPLILDMYYLYESVYQFSERENNYKNRFDYVIENHDSLDVMDYWHYKVGIISKIDLGDYIKRSGKYKKGDIVFKKLDFNPPSLQIVNNSYLRLIKISKPPMLLYYQNSPLRYVINKKSQFDDLLFTRFLNGYFI